MTASGIFAAFSSIMLAAAALPTLAAVRHVGQADFSRPLVITEDRTRLVFTESVVVDFGAAELFGQFAAVVVAADDVTIDLDGHSLSMAPEFADSQRFFNLIELGNQPFVQGQGPADFGGFWGTSGVEVCCGHLGLSSHNGIHGNDVSRAEIHHLTVTDFEVAGIQINGADDVSIHHTDIGPSRSDVTFLGTLSQATFLRPFLAAHPHPHEEVDFGPYGVLSTAAVLQELDAALSNPAAEPLFANPAGLPDGSAIYGIIVNTRGVAVGSLGGAADASSTEDVILHHNTVHDLQVAVHEWGIADGFVGPVGDQLNFALVTDASGKFNGGNVLFRAQATLQPDGPLRQWMADQTSSIDEAAWFRPVCGLDLMGHVIKGGFGVRVDLTEDVTLKHLTVTGVHSTVAVRSPWCPATDTTAPSRGISVVAATRRLRCSHVDVCDADLPYCVDTEPHTKAKVRLCGAPFAAGLTANPQCW